MKLKLKITDRNSDSLRFEEKEFDNCEQAIEYIDSLEAECSIVRAYEIGTGKRIVGGELVKINKQ